MTHDFGTMESMKQELEQILKRNSKFGSLHYLKNTDDDELILTCDNEVLRPRAKGNQAAYISFMEEISDCLMEFGYCLTADEDATEHERNNYLFIVPDDEADFDD